MWELHAHDFGDRFMHIGHECYVKAHMISNKPIVKVQVKEDPEGRYYGFIRTPIGIMEDPPEMIWYDKRLFDMCFHNGSEAEEKAGKGRVVKLTITKI